MASHNKQKKSSFLQILALLDFISRRRKIQFFSLILLMIVTGVAEMLTVLSISPFVGSLISPNQNQLPSWMGPVIQLLGVGSAQNLRATLAILFVSIVLIAAFIRSLSILISNRFVALMASDLSCMAFDNSLIRDYSYFIETNSNSIISTLTSSVSRTSAALMAFVSLIASSIIGLFLLMSLLLVNTLLAISGVLFIGFTYYAIAFCVRKRLLANNHSIVRSSSKQIQVINETLSSIRDVILGQSQGYYSKKYKNEDRVFRLLQAENQFLGAFPRYLIEAVGMTAIAIFAISSSYDGQLSSKSMIPLLGVLAIAAQKLLPTVQQIYTSWSTLKSTSIDIANLTAMIEPVNTPAFNYNNDDIIVFKSSIKLQSISFRYAAALPLILNDISFTINRGERIGIIGTTGSGKSTLVDILMGLLSPSSGTIVVDDAPLHFKGSLHTHHIQQWRAKLSHVPQEIYLSDSSFVENIAFGVDAAKIDYDLVIESAKQAQIHSFILTTEHGYHTFVGEKGVRLSGGQKQRIAIARALYHRSEIIFFDEATSALDTQTEQEVMHAIEKLSSDLTLILVAHRTSTLKLCNRVIRLENGAISFQGSPGNLPEISTST